MIDAPRRTAAIAEAVTLMTRALALLDDAEAFEAAARLDHALRSLQPAKNLMPLDDSFDL